MATTYFEVQAVGSAPRDDGVYEYWVLMHGPTGEGRVPVSADALLDYYVFQRELLTRGGFLYRFEPAESRPSPALANEEWKRFLATIMNNQFVQLKAQADQPPPPAGGAMN